MKRLNLFLHVLFMANLILAYQANYAFGQSQKKLLNKQSEIIDEVPDRILPDRQNNDDSPITIGHSIFNPFDKMIYVAVHKDGSSELDYLYKINPKSKIDISTNQDLIYIIKINESTYCSDKFNGDKNYEIYWNDEKKCYCLKDKN